MQKQGSSNANSAQECSVALGYFDGVHMGHRKVIFQAVQWAKQHHLSSAVFTFDLPQDSTLKGQRILSVTEKKRRMFEMGVEKYISPAFQQIQEMSPKAFVTEYLKNQCHAKAVFCGENFTFGKGKAGNTALLQQLCKENEIVVEIVPLAWENGQAISSTRIRQLLQDGQMEHANQLLGQPYCVDYPVEHGKGNGKVWGFPTINQLFPKGSLIPKQGVYVTRVQLQDGSWHAGATGLGNRPTVSGEGITCETFLPEYQGDLYGQQVRVEFCRYLKPTVKFNSVEELKQYVFDAADVAVKEFYAHQK